MPSTIDHLLNQVHHADAREFMSGLPEGCVDAVVTDPPAGIGFMGKDWDHNKGGRAKWVAWLTEIMQEALRVMKPGAHAFVWALPRTSHWTATAIEDAGFEIRDVVMHVFGSGFPKSLDVSKAIDKMAGAEREVIGLRGDTIPDMRGNSSNGRGISGEANTGKERLPFQITVPATEASKQWDGWGTALKPAAEHWILARKPLEGTVAQNVLSHGTGAINVDGCRVDGKVVSNPLVRNARGYSQESLIQGKIEGGSIESTGRFPANVIHDGSDEVLEGFPETSPSNGGAGGSYGLAEGVNEGWKRPAHKNYKPKPLGSYAIDSGSAARFFYCAKPSPSERDQGNKHPTVKPIALMRYLCRLITPPGGLILDPFAGSGTTCIAAHKEGFRWIACDSHLPYVEIARARIARETAQLSMFTQPPTQKEAHP